MASHLLDSDVLIWVLRGKPEAIRFVQDLLKEEIPAISSLALYEVWAGARTNEEEAITSFLSAFEIMPVSAEIARDAAHYYKQYRRRGITLSTADALIAATARVQKLILVTQNQRDFPMTDIEKRSLK